MALLCFLDSLVSTFSFIISHTDASSASWHSRSILYTGPIVPCIILCYTKPSTSLTINGSVRGVGSLGSLSVDIPSAVPTPFASHAFHPVDGYIQSLPYHLFVFLFPLHRGLYLCLFVFVNLWTIFVCRVLSCTPDTYLNVPLPRFMIPT